ncbi:MAG: 3-isopropylmalate dehydratase [Acetobacteraceae bacterium]|nr:3-isopropylmalate dehydratase [Acetobacteraceae bacterium]
MPPLRGRVAFVFDEPDFDVDQIVGVKNIKIQDVEELARVAMQAYDPDFRAKLRPGDILIGGANFGYGHPHYPPMRAMRHMGIAGVVAESFSPGYWRGEISMGFPQAACPGVLAAVSRWDEIEVDYADNLLRNLTRGTQLPIEALSAGDAAMLAAGGLLPYLKRDLATGDAR